MHRSALGCFVSCLLLTAPDAAAAQPESRFTSIDNKDCRFETGDDEDQVKRCPGLGGARVVVNAFHARLRIGFTWSDRRRAEPKWVVEAWSAGQRVEWRGTAGAKGFAPFAATVRMLFPKEGTPQPEQQVLAVIRLQRGAPCLMGAVDIRANKDAYAQARALADTAPAFACGKDRPRVLGVETEWARALLPKG
jgi:hypothetical protein